MDKELQNRIKSAFNHCYEESEEEYLCVGGDTEDHGEITQLAKESLMDNLEGFELINMDLPSEELKKHEEEIEQYLEKL